VVAGLLLVTRGTTTTESAATILQKSSAAQMQALAALGPDTTVHGVGFQHTEQTDAVRNGSQWALPDDTIQEGFTSFDATGKLVVFSSVTRGTDGHVYQHSELVGHDLVLTDVASGKTSRVPNWDSITIDQVRTRENQTLAALLAAVGPSTTAKVAVVDSTAAYVVQTATSRTYIDQNDYHVLRSEELAPDGHVRQYTVTTTFEVLPSCCSLQLDMDPATPGVQPAISVSGPQDISVDVVLGNNIGPLAAFNFKLIYDDTRLSPAGALPDPAVNIAALGSGYACGLPATSGQPDIDPATGAGHGVALLSCFNTQGVTLSAPTVLATLRLHVNASGQSTVTLADAGAGNDQGAELGSCEPVYAREMTCVGGSVTAP